MIFCVSYVAFFIRMMSFTIIFYLEKETVGWIRNQYDFKPTLLNETIFNDENPHPYRGTP